MIAQMKNVSLKFLTVSVKKKERKTPLQLLIIPILSFKLYNKPISCFSQGVHGTKLCTLKWQEECLKTSLKSMVENGLFSSSQAWIALLVLQARQQTRMPIRAAKTSVDTQGPLHAPCNSYIDILINKLIERQIIESKQVVAKLTCVRGIFLLMQVYRLFLVSLQKQYLLSMKISMHTHPVIHIDREQRLDRINIFIVSLSLKALKKIHQRH